MPTGDMDTNSTAISLRDLNKSFDRGRSFAVRGVSLDVAAGEFVAVVGMSGSGKTTLLKTINRLIEPTSGIVTVENQNVQEFDPFQLRRRIGYVFQGIGLFPH